MCTAVWISIIHVQTRDTHLEFCAYTDLKKMQIDQIAYPNKPIAYDSIAVDLQIRLSCLQPTIHTFASG